jgi:hypothetical protein
MRSDISVLCSLAFHLSVHLYADIRAHDTTKGALGAILFILINAVMVARSIEIVGHNKYPMWTCLNAELTSLAALPLNNNVVHNSLPFSFSST